MSPEERMGLTIAVLRRISDLESDLDALTQCREIRPSDLMRVAGNLTAINTYLRSRLEEVK